MVQTPLGKGLEQAELEFVSRDIGQSDSDKTHALRRGHRVERATAMQRVNMIPEDRPLMLLSLDGFLERAAVLALPVMC